MMCWGDFTTIAQKPLAEYQTAVQFWNGGTMIGTLFKKLQTF